MRYPEPARRLRQQTSRPLSRVVSVKIVIPTLTI
jgi:hypothetical protein